MPFPELEKPQTPPKHKNEEKLKAMGKGFDRRQTDVFYEVGETEWQMEDERIAAEEREKSKERVYEGDIDYGAMLD